MLDSLVYPSVERSVYDKELPELQDRLEELFLKAYSKKRAAVFVFEGMDAAGKGGAIKRMVRKLDPELYAVRPFGAPNDEEKERHYLWRFYRSLPRPGRNSIFDRSWYGRVLVERVEGFASEDEWKRAYQEILDMERSFTNCGMIVVKFWLQITMDEQLERFNDRAESPLKSWKLTDDDWRNREKWPLYKAAVEEMLEKTSVPWAPWTVIEANDKLFARLKVLRTAINALENTL